MTHRVVEDRELQRLIRAAVKDAFTAERDTRKAIGFKLRASAKRPKALVFPERDSFVTVREVAAFFSVSKHSVYRLIDAGQLKATTIGESKRILWSDVHDLVFG